MKETSLNDVLFFKSKQLIESNGNLIPVEFDNAIPFTPVRAFFIYGVPNQESRGKHAHFTNKQVIFCINGKITVTLNDGTNQQRYDLITGDCIYIPNMIWDEQIYHSENTVLISLCSIHYDISDYITNFNEFKELKKQWIIQ